MNLLNGVSFFLPPPPLDLAKQGVEKKWVINVSLNDHSDDDVLFLTGFSVAVLVVAGAICDDLLVGRYGRVEGQRHTERVFVA